MTLIPGFTETQRCGRASAAVRLRDQRFLLSISCSTVAPVFLRSGPSAPKVLLEMRNMYQTQKDVSFITCCSCLGVSQLKTHKPIAQRISKDWRWPDRKWQMKSLKWRYFGFTSAKCEKIAYFKFFLLICVVWKREMRGFINRVAFVKGYVVTSEGEQSALATQIFLKKSNYPLSSTRLVVTWLVLFDNFVFLSPEIKYRRQPFHCPSETGSYKYATGYVVVPTNITFWLQNVNNLIEMSYEDVCTLQTLGGKRILVLFLSDGLFPGGCSPQNAL